MAQRRTELSVIRSAKRVRRAYQMRYNADFDRGGPVCDAVLTHVPSVRVAAGSHPHSLHQDGGTKVDDNNDRRPINNPFSRKTTGGQCQTVRCSSRSGSEISIASFGTPSAAPRLTGPGLWRASQQCVVAISVNGGSEPCSAAIKGRSRDSVRGGSSRLNGASVGAAEDSCTDLHSLQQGGFPTLRRASLGSQGSNNFITDDGPSMGVRSFCLERCKVLGRSSISSSSSSASSATLLSGGMSRVLQGASHCNVDDRSDQQRLSCDSFDCTAATAIEPVGPPTWRWSSWCRTGAGEPEALRGSSTCRSFEVSVLKQPVNRPGRTSAPTSDSVFPSGKKNGAIQSENSSLTSCPELPEDQSTNPLGRDVTDFGRGPAKTFVSSNVTAATPPTECAPRVDFKKTNKQGQRSSSWKRRDSSIFLAANSARLPTVADNNNSWSRNKTPTSTVSTKGWNRRAPGDESKFVSKCPESFSGGQMSIYSDLVKQPRSACNKRGPRTKPMEAMSRPDRTSRLDTGCNSNNKPPLLGVSTTIGNSDFLATTTSTSCEGRFETSASDRDTPTRAKKSKHRKQRKRKRNVYIPRDKEWSEVGVSVYRVGIAMYHSCLVVDNVEWHYWQGIGVEPLPRYFDHQQQSYISVNHVPHISYVPIQTVFLSPKDIATLCDELGESQFSPYCYDIIRCNCNHFTYEVLTRLQLEHKMPVWINRLARAADVVCHRLPFVRFWIDTLLSSSSTKQKITNDATKCKPGSTQPRALLQT